MQVDGERVARRKGEMLDLDGRGFRHIAYERGMIAGSAPALLLRPRPRKLERSMRTLRAVAPFVIARNQVSPLRLAKAATCRISETGRTTVSSQ